MKLIQIFMVFIFLYVSSSNNAFCFAQEEDHLSPHMLLFNQISISENPSTSLIFSVLDHGAKGDGVTNDAEAFNRTWDAACRTQGGVMLVPSKFTFLLHPVNFDGSYCQPNVVVQVDGKIVAPKKSDWVTKDFQWILFTGLSKGLTIKGEGFIDGNGASWWNSGGADPFRPNALRITHSSNITVTGITIQNSPQMHIYFDNSEYVLIYNFSVSAPGDSPNTDGVHFAATQHVDIHNTTISCGDDCVSIQTRCSDVKINNVYCGPGHGYSIGGLGPNKEEAQVSDITVLNSVVQDSLTGVRIKTWPGGRGSVQNIVFSNILVSNVGTPVVIDQHYCGTTSCNGSDSNAVAVSNVTFSGIKGTYSYKSVYLQCSEFAACRHLTLANINIVPTSAKAQGGLDKPYCSNAYGEVLTNTNPPLNDCLSPEKAVLMSPENPTPAAPQEAVPPVMPPESFPSRGYVF